MPTAERATLRFLRQLLRDGSACAGENGRFRLAVGAGSVSLDAARVRALQSRGIVGGDVHVCRATAETANWLRRQMLGPHSAPGREIVSTPSGAVVNIAESPLARLATPAPGEAGAFLSRAQLEAGEHIRRLIERAQLRPRVTMSYDAARVANRHGGGTAGDISDLAVDARRRLARLLAGLPAECADVVVDVCGFLKGLQTVETERQWPRRSAKLVLRIGLEQLARQLGLAQTAEGAVTRRLNSWLEPGARPGLGLPAEPPA